MMRRILLSLLALLPVVGTTAAEPHQVKTIEIESTATGRKLSCNVALPHGYDPKGDKRYPVIYLLHGYSGNFTNWERNQASRSAEGMDVILVMPDGGNSWYVNWGESEGGRPEKWEDFIAKELVSYIDRNYKTIASREGRAINGLSMGGYGALTIGLKHPELYGAVGTSSGALEHARQIGRSLEEGKSIVRSREGISTKPDPRVPTPGFSSQEERTPKGKIFTSVEDAEKNDPFSIVLKTPRERLPHLNIDCGTEDVLLPASREFVKLLTENKIPFTYSESPGKHDRAYWTKVIGTDIAIQLAALKQVAAKP